MVSQHMGRLEAKIVEDIEKQMVRRVHWDGKVPGASAGTRAVAASGPECASACRTILGREPGQQLPPLPNREDRVAPGWSWMLEVSRENKDEVGDAQRQCLPAETVDIGWVFTREIGEPGDAWRTEKGWAMMDPNLDSPGLFGKMGCVRGWALVRSNSFDRRILFKKRLSLAVYRTFLQCPALPLPQHPHPHLFSGGAHAPTVATPSAAPPPPPPPRKWPKPTDAPVAEAELLPLCGPAAGAGSLRGRRRCPPSESSRTQRLSSPHKDLTQWGS